MDRHRILIVDYGLGNIASLGNALDRLGYQWSVSSRPEDMAGAGGFILPGVGAFAEGMRNLRQGGLLQALEREVLDGGKPVLGICLGMQLLARDSDEGGLNQGLGWIDGHVRLLRPEDGLRVPHVGWNGLRMLRREPLFSRSGEEPCVYFDHSYHFQCPERHVAAVCDYGGEVVAAVQRENIFGVQFHPEKSQAAGLRILRGLFHSTGFVHHAE